MISIDIPGFRTLNLEHLVLDYNGTLAVDGQLLPGVAEALTVLAAQISIHVVTADTFGLAETNLKALPVDLTIAPPQAQTEAKLRYMSELGVDSVVAIGNGRNDRKMLQAAALGIAVVEQEGVATETLGAADVFCRNVLDALELLRHPKRLVATLRS